MPLEPKRTLRGVVERTFLRQNRQPGFAVRLPDDRLVFAWAEDVYRAGVAVHVVELDLGEWCVLGLHDEAAA